MQYAVQTTNLCKTFSGVHAVRDLSLRVPEGSIYGFIGDNGSGKSTTEKLICGLLVPTSGDIQLFGKQYTDANERARLGVLIENPACFPSSTVYQNLYMQALNLDVHDPHKEVKRVLELVNLAGAAKRKFKQCSLGMKQRIGVAQSLMGDPKLLILDEPINGLDADGMRIVRETLIKINRERGTTILISSHILGELERIATHIGIIKGGRLVREMVSSDIQKECQSFVSIKSDDDAKAISILQAIYRDVSVVDGSIRVHDAVNSNDVIRVLFGNGIGIQEVSYQQIGLEEYYLDTMQKESKHE